MKKFISGSRTSNDGSMNGHGHKKSDSVLSEEIKGTWNQTDQDVSGRIIYNAWPGAQTFFQDASLQDFDDLMRSDSTMKVSLTPDRLKTMEVYPQPLSSRYRAKLLPGV